MTGVVRTLQPRPARMLQLAREGFTTMTDLADALVRETGMPFREAHEIVAQVVETALAQGKGGNGVDLAMVQAAARTRLGRTLTLDAAAVRDALDPARNVARRAGPGGPAPAAVTRAIAAARAELAATSARREHRQRLLAEAEQTLARAEAQALGGS